MRRESDPSAMLGLVLLIVAGAVGVFVGTLVWLLVT